jgi:hypothetical protein
MNQSSWCAPQAHWCVLIRGCICYYVCACDPTLGNYFNQLTFSAGCLLWIKFNEGTDVNAADSCQSNVAVWNGVTSWQPKDNNPACVPGYFHRWKIELVASSVRVGMPATIKVIQIDQNGNSMTAYDPPPAGTTVSINVVGGTSTLLPTGSTSVAISDGFGTFQIRNEKVETVTFALTDLNKAPRTPSGPSPVQAFHGPDVRAVTLTAGGAVVPYTPPLTPLIYSFTASSVSYFVTTMVVKAKFTQTATLTVNDVDFGSLTSDTDSIPFTLNVGENIIAIVSNEEGTYTYSFRVTRLSPDVTAIDLLASPELASITPAFEAGSLVPRTAAVPGILTTLAVRATFKTVGSLTLIVNGQSFGVMPKDSPIDVTSALHAGANIVQLTSIPDGGTFTYTLGTGESTIRRIPAESSRSRTHDGTPVMMRTWSLHWCCDLGVIRHQLIRSFLSCHVCPVHPTCSVSRPLSLHSRSCR